MVITGRAHDNSVFGSFIGTQILGVKALGNKKGGVLIAGHAYRNLIGQKTRTPSNLISGNTGIGVTLSSGTFGNFVLNNYIGLDRFGRYLRNSGRPIVNTGHHNTIRGNGPVPSGTDAGSSYSHHADSVCRHGQGSGRSARENGAESVLTPWLPYRPSTCGNCRLVHDHPDLRGNVPDPA